MQEELKRKVALRVRAEGREGDAEIKDAASKFFGDPVGWGLHRYAYYKCFKCAKLYYGGLKRCGAGGGREPDPSELLCASCVPGAGEVVCAKHGDEFIAWCVSVFFSCYRFLFFFFVLSSASHSPRFPVFCSRRKCRFCCSVSAFLCGGVHNCHTCHEDFGTMSSMMSEKRLPPCPAAPRGVALPEGTPCPLGCAHPPPGEEMSLGCSMCREGGTY